MTIALGNDTNVTLMPNLLLLLMPKSGHNVATFHTSTIRFDEYDFSAEQQQMGGVLDSDLGSTEPMSISEEQVVKQLKRINPRKSAGSDGVNILIKS